MTNDPQTDSTKSPLISKTLWTNIVATIAILVQTKTGFVIDPGYQAAILGVINLVLRIVTKKPLSWGPGSQSGKSSLILLLFVLPLVSATPTLAKTVVLSWDKSPSTVDGYKVYASTENTVVDLLPGFPADAGNVLTYMVTGLDDSATHYFAVTAYKNSNGESVYSNIVKSDPCPPRAEPPILHDPQNQCRQYIIINNNLGGNQ